mgnify:CR=1 FL=1
MAFQPIIDLAEGRIWGYEALVRGRDGEGAAAVLAAVTDQNRYRFDQACRVKAIELAGTRMPAGSTAKLSINVLPNAVYEPTACIRATWRRAWRSTRRSSTPSPIAACGASRDGSCICVSN